MPKTTVYDIARGTFLTQLQAINANLSGCIEGKDPIHLHDLRVANRRTRAALIEFKALFPGESLVKYQDGFRWIQRITGEVRDLDVGLQHIPVFQKQILKEWRPLLEPLRILFEDKREIAQRILEKDLQSSQLTDLLSGWFEILDGDLMKGSPLSIESAREYGCHRIIKRYQQVRKKGRKLTKTTPAKDFHAYRITIKNIRYLMEFFRPVLDNDQYSSLRRRVKTVQDAFGVFQDTDVQAENIRSLAGELQKQSVGVDTLLALGLLLGTLEKTHRKSKKNCIKQVRWITEDATARTFQTCFQYPVD